MSTQPEVRDSRPAVIGGKAKNTNSHSDWIVHEEDRTPARDS